MKLFNTQSKNRKLLKTISLFFATTVPVTAVASVVSCGNNKTDSFDRSYDMSKVKWSDFKLAEEVTVVSWIDGDTLTVKKEDGTRKNLRISFIDTPETHVSNGGTTKSWSDTSGLEHDYGIKALEFGKSEMPNGSKIKVDFEPGESYGRWVGSVFYGTNFDQNYETNIVKKGLALPFIGSVNYLSMHDETSMLHYLGKPIADAYNYALNNKQGLFERNLNDVLKVHGSTNLDSVKYDLKSTKSIYHYLDADAWED